MAGLLCALLAPGGRPCLNVAQASTLAQSSKGDQKSDESNSRSLPKAVTIIVGDRALTGAFSAPQERGSKMFLPVVGIARALGDAPSVNASTRNIEVRRQTGVVAEFSAALNRVTENGATILVLSSTADIVFPPNSEELMLPIEIVAPLLDVSIIQDESSRTLRVTRGGRQVDAVKPGAHHSAWEIYQIDYYANINIYSGAYNQNFTLHSNGRINDGRFDLLTNLNGGSGQGPLSMSRATFSYERQNGQRYTIGDFGTGNELEFMSSMVRGLWAQRPVGDVLVSAFGGRTVSDLQANVVRSIDPVSGPPLEALPLIEPRYDTNIAGSYVSFGPSVSNPSNSTLLLFSSGGMYFSGPESSSKMITGSMKYTSSQNQFQGDLGLGRFSGLSFPTDASEARAVDGFAPMIDVSELFRLKDNLTLQGRFTHIGSNFVSPQANGFLTPVNLLAGGLSWRPRSWLNASVNTLSRARLDVADQKDRSTTASISVTPRGWMPTIIFIETFGNNSFGGKTSYTFLNATKQLNRWRLFGSFTRIRNDIPSRSNPGPASAPSESISAGAMVRIKEHHSVQASQSFGSGGTYGGSFDYLTSSFFSKRITFGAGFNYNYSSSTLTTAERFLTTIQLPRQQALQFTYVQTPNGPQIMAQLSGPLFTSRRAEAAITAPLAEFNSLGAFYGKVYQDINLNGKFDPSVDQPQANVQIRVDGSYFTTSDANGEFKIENVKAGEHTVYLDLLSVRADLTLLSGAQQAATLYPGRDSIVDFRLVRTGRIKGLVWMDSNGSGSMDEGERPLADVRIVTGSNRDTLTDAQGEFVLGDLPPGEHVLLIDEKTLPENAKSATGSVRVVVKAGTETGDVSLPVIAKPVEVNIKQFSPNTSSKDRDN